MSKIIGFSTIEPKKKGSWKLYGSEIIKRDLLNELYTRKGERYMLPEYGCIVWDMIMEKLNDTNKEIIYDDIVNIVKKDTRCTLKNITMKEIEHGLQIELDIEFYNKSSDTLVVDFKNNQGN